MLSFNKSLFVVLLRRIVLIFPMNPDALKQKHCLQSTGEIRKWTDKGISAYF